MQTTSLLQRLRLQYQPKLPIILKDIALLKLVLDDSKASSGNTKTSPFFPKTSSQPAYLSFEKGPARSHLPKKVGVLFSGGQAAGGHNVITGLYDALMALNEKSQLIGFLDGSKGLLEDNHQILTAKILDEYRNQGGFDLIGSGRTKIEAPDQFKAAETAARSHKLDGLVIIGGDDSNTNAAFLAEYFLEKGCKTVVVGVPKTIDGDLKNEDVEISFGFDSATKTYSEIIGNLMRDALSAKKYHFFIKLMGRSASHIALECALQTHPNMTLIGEEVAEQNKTLEQITEEICDLICRRSMAGNDYVVCLIPEGIVEFIPEVKKLIGELNDLLVAEKPHLRKMESLTTKEEKSSYIAAQLTSPSAHCFQSIPQDIQMQLLLDRDPHGNIQVSKIETEKLFIEMASKELNQRKTAGEYKGKFSPLSHFLGYEGRSCLPTNFDAQYCYALGHVAALFIDAEVTGYMCCVQNLISPVEQWTIKGRSLVTMIDVEQRHGKAKPVISKALVDLNGAPFGRLREMRAKWELEDEYCFPGPIQFFGPAELTDNITLTLAYEANFAPASRCCK